MLPMSVNNEPLQWQPTSGAPAQGDWQAPGKGALPSTQPGTPPPAPDGQSGAMGVGRSQSIARGQIGGAEPDPIITLIKRICDGRAEGVDVRYTGSKRLTVCFECKTTPEAQKLVRDISAREELVSYRIDFCVLVK